MKSEFVGVLVRIKPARVFGKNNIKQVEFHCREEDPTSKSKYPNLLPFVVKHDPTFDKWDDTKALEKLSIGDKIHFTFQLKGREWDKDGDTKVFVDNLVVSKINVLASATANSSRANVQEKLNHDVQEQEDYDMPF